MFDKTATVFDKTAALFTLFAKAVHTGLIAPFSALSWLYSLALTRILIFSLPSASVWSGTYLYEI
jgi:hypothetical protein